MNIHNNPHVTNLYSQNLTNRPNAQPGSTPKAQTEAKGIDLGEKDQLKILKELNAQPEVRPEVVAKGKELLKDPNYPSKEMMEAIAKLIVPFADEE